MNRTALAKWKQKLSYLQEQEAITADPLLKVQIRQNIEECREKIQKLQPAIAWGKLSAIPVICLVLVLVIPSLSKQFNSSGNILSTYHNPKYRLSMSYPKNWTKQDIGSDWEDSGIIARFSAQNQDSSPVNPQVALSINEYPIATPSLDEVVAQVTKPLNADQILKNSPTLLAGNEARLIEYNWQDALKHNLKVRQIVMVKGEQVYGIIYTASAEEFEQFLPIVEQQMIESFQVISGSK
jgi:hypothetical protein